MIPALYQAARRMCGVETVSVLLEAGVDLGVGHAGAAPLSAAEELLAAAAEDRVPAGPRFPRRRCLAGGRISSAISCTGLKTAAQASAGVMRPV